MYTYTYIDIAEVFDDEEVEIFAMANCDLYAQENKKTDKICV
jgi:hypothetical protein